MTKYLFLCHGFSKRKSEFRGTAHRHYSLLRYHFLASDLIEGEGAALDVRIVWCR